MSFSLRLLTGLVVVALVGAGAMIALRDSSSDSNSDSPRASASAPEQPATSALYLSGDGLMRLDLDSGDRRRIGRTPTRDVYASPAGSWLAYVVSADDPTGEEHDFLAEPTLLAIDLDSGKKVEIGPGFNPLWHPNDSKLAYLRPIFDRRCSGESCKGLVEVVVYDAEINEHTVLAEAGRYNPLAWSGDRVLVADESDLSATFILGPDDAERLDIEPSELWDASPDGRWLLRSGSGEVSLIDMESGERRPVAIGSGVLGDGAWSPDSKHIAVGVLNDARSKTRAVLIDTTEGEVEEITQELPGILDLTWGADARAFGFLTFVGRSNR
ncbi:MAG: hypothetical protein ACRDJL_07940, partial [Actinomycetota bacterium]